jgi:type I restriction enzyme S subunit
MDDDQLYRLLTVKRGRGGVVEREHLLGREISVKSQFLVEAGDFLISKRQIVHGACGIVPEHLEGSIVSNEYAVLRGNAEIDMGFLKYLAHSVHFQQTCFHSSIGVHIEKMLFKLDRWLKWEFDLPPLLEQQKIAEILATWDQAIEAVEKLITNSKAQKKALMQLLLGGAEHLGEKESNWASYRFNHFAHRRKTKCNPAVSDIDHPCIELEHVESKTGRLLGRTSAKGQDSIKSVFQTGDVLFGKLRPYLRKFNQPTFDGVCSSEFWVLNANEEICLPRYLYYVVQTSSFQRATGISSGSKMPRAEWDVVKDFTFALPSIEEQRAIINVLEPAEKLINGLSDQLSVLKSEKSALMQQLLTGKRRVKAMEEVA